MHLEVATGGHLKTLIASEQSLWKNSLLIVAENNGPLMQ